MLQVKNATKYYGDLRAVNNISFQVEKGKLFGLLGTNGAGKTTTFKMIMGLLDPTEGEIILDGKNVNYDMAKDIGYLIEERSLMPKWKVYEQLLYIGKLKEMSKKDIDKRIDELLEKFDCMQYKNKKVKELSKGNQQKIQFISAIINEPKLLILDEPFSGLDPFNIKLFIEEIRELMKKDTIIIFSSHQMNHVEEFCEDLIILVKGDSVLEGNINQIKEDFTKKIVEIIGDVDIDTLRGLEGVLNVVEDINSVKVTVEDKNYIAKVFEYVKTCNNITKFEAKLPSLGEVFIEKVGSKYEG